MELDKLSSDSLNVIDLAKAKALTARHSAVGSEHILFGLAKSDTRIGKLLASTIKIEDLEAQTRFFGGCEAPSEDLRFTKHAISVLEAASEHTDSSTGLVEPTQILIAILKHDNCKALKILSNLKVDTRRIEAQVTEQPYRGFLTQKDFLRSTVISDLIQEDLMLRHKSLSKLSKTDLITRIGQPDFEEDDKLSFLVRLSRNENAIRLTVTIREGIVSGYELVREGTN